MRIGKLDRRVAIERFTETINNFGERELTWTTAFACWASLAIIKTGSTEKLVDGAERAVKMAEWTIRNTSDSRTITPGDRLVYDGKIFDIVAVHELERGVDFRLITEHVS